MISDTFATVFFTLMGLILVFGMIWISGINKETARIQKEISDRKLSQKKPA